MEKKTSSHIFNNSSDVTCSDRALGAKDGGSTAAPAQPTEPVLVTTLLSFNFPREGRQSLLIGKESDPMIYCAVKETKDKGVA